MKHWDQKEKNPSNKNLEKTTPKLKSILSEPAKKLKNDSI